MWHIFQDTFPEIILCMCLDNETALQRNAISHWQGAYTEWSLILTHLALVIPHGIFKWSHQQETSINWHFLIANITIFFITLIKYNSNWVIIVAADGLVF